MKLFLAYLKSRRRVMAALFVAALLTDRIGKKKGGVVHG